MSTVPLEMASSSSNAKPSRSTCSGACGCDISFKPACASADHSSGLFPPHEVRHVLPDRHTPCPDKNSRSLGAVRLSWANTKRLAKTAFDASDAASKSRTDIFGLVATVAFKHLASEGTIDVHSQEKLSDFARKVAASKHVSETMTKRVSDILQL